MVKNYFYKCTNCGREFPGDGVLYRCTECIKTDQPGQPQKGMLKVEYTTFGHFTGDAASRLKAMQDEGFLSILPINSLESLGPLRVGETPVVEVKKLESEMLAFRLFLKDDSQNPTFSFKDRASVMVSAFAKEHNIDTIVAASTGNAGSSLAGICASQGQKAIILVPANAPAAKLTQIKMYGARLITVEGNYDTAFDRSIALTQEHGWYNRNTAYNPITIEGKKTVAFEITGSFFPDLPDRIYVPCGDGAILAGVYKGFGDLMKAGVIARMPVLVAVQSEGSDNLVRNFNSEVFVSKPSTTEADSISVDIPRNFYMAKAYFLQYGGERLCVSDSEIREASSILARNTGIFSEPAAVAAFAGMLKDKASCRIKDNSQCLVLLTGSGLKDIGFVQT